MRRAYGRQKEKWVARRWRALGNQQARTVTVVSYKDDLLVLATGSKAEADYDQAVPWVLKK